MALKEYADESDSASCKVTLRDLGVLGVSMFNLTLSKKQVRVSSTTLK